MERHGKPPGTGAIAILPRRGTYPSGSVGMILTLARFSLAHFSRLPRFFGWPTVEGDADSPTLQPHA